MTNERLFLPVTWHNAIPFVLNALRSSVNAAATEVIVSGDASDDATPNIANEYPSRPVLHEHACRAMNELVGIGFQHNITNTAKILISQIGGNLRQCKRYDA